MKASLLFILGLAVLATVANAQQKAAQIVTASSSSTGEEGDGVWRSWAVETNTALAGWIVTLTFVVGFSIYITYAVARLVSRSRILATLAVMLPSLFATTIYYMIAWYGGLVYTVESPVDPTVDIETEFYFLIASFLLLIPLTSLAFVSYLTNVDIAQVLRKKSLRDNLSSSERDPINANVVGGFSASGWAIALVEFGFYLCALMVTYWPSAWKVIVALGAFALFMLIVLYGLVVSAAWDFRKKSGKPGSYSWFIALFLMYGIINKIGFVLIWGFGPAVATAYNYFNACMICYLVLYGVILVIMWLLTVMLDVYRPINPNDVANGEADLAAAAAKKK